MASQPPPASPSTPPTPIAAPIQPKASVARDAPATSESRPKSTVPTGAIVAP